MVNGQIFLVCFIALIASTGGFQHHSITKRSCYKLRPYSHVLVESNNIHNILSNARIAVKMSKLALFMSTEASPPEESLIEQVVDANIAQLESTGSEGEAPRFEIGQEYNGVVARAKSNGIIVNITSTASDTHSCAAVFMPRSRISKGTFERLRAEYNLYKKAPTSLICVPVRVEITNICPVNGTLTGKYLSPAGVTALDPTTVAESELHIPPAYRRKFNATVVRANQLGVVVEVEELGGAEGLIPTTAVPATMIVGSIVKTFT